MYNNKIPDNNACIVYLCSIQCLVYGRKWIWFTIVLHNYVKCDVIKCTAETRLHNKYPRFIQLYDMNKIFYYTPKLWHLYDVEYT